MQAKLLGKDPLPLGPALPSPPVLAGPQTKLWDVL